MDMKLEVVVIPVSDVDKAKDFYQGLGWRLDANFAKGEDFRVVQCYDSAADPAQALRRAAAAHGQHTQATT
jgi:catechol 2,3-dioxygenase-like lactoylglutathione lyase family enzyme